MYRCVRVIDSEDEGSEPIGGVRGLVRAVGEVLRRRSVYKFGGSYTRAYDGCGKEERMNRVEQGEG